MDFDPNAVAQGAGAFKAIFDSLRSAIGLLKDIRASGGGTQEQQKLVDEALDTAGRATKIAEAQVAKALGYELCKCEFPPIPMKTVGRLNGMPRFGPVYECPKCGYDTASPVTYTRTAPPRTTLSAP
jgi:predicted RNA-binding Zn-ribbon protein involved in translation (DUF1610 family)